MIAKNSENEFYCSQLVWRAWYKVSPDYDIKPAKAAILPHDLIPGNSDEKTYKIISYRNK